MIITNYKYRNLNNLLEIYMQMINLNKIFTSKNKIYKIENFYNNIVSLARNENLYLKAGVPDTLDGRFELIILHCHFFVKKLLEIGTDEKIFAQNLINFMFKDFDRSLREIGVGDLSVGKKVKFMVSSYYGRINAYENALSKNNKINSKVLEKNLYGTVTPDIIKIEYMKIYISNLILFLDSLNDNEVLICFQKDINLFKGLKYE
jgi:cytochrome b pre-mRNA-processing protein 3